MYPNFKTRAKFQELLNSRDWFILGIVADDRKDLDQWSLRRSNFGIKA